MKTKIEKLLNNLAMNSKLKISGDPIIGNSNPIGKCNISQAHFGNFEDNVEAAIMDISSIIAIPINTIITNNDGVNPGGISQMITISFSGLYTPTILTDGDTVVENIMGIKTPLKVNYTGKEVATAFYNASRAYIDRNELISDSVLNADGTSVTITAIDFSNHEIPSFQVGFQLNAEVTVTSPAKYGYGTWIKLGMETKTLPNVADPIEFHYFKRIA